MACRYATCVDNGNKTKCYTDIVICGNCGKIAPRGNNICDDIKEVALAETNNKVGPAETNNKVGPAETNNKVGPAETNNKVGIQPPEFVTNAEKPASKNICRCKESCREWIWSFLGFGSSLPGCCKDYPVTVWDSGEAARTALRDTLVGVPPSDRSGEKKIHYIKRSSKVNLAENVTVPVATLTSSAPAEVASKHTDESSEYNHQQGIHGDKDESIYDNRNKKVELSSKKFRLKHKRGSSSSIKSSKSNKSAKSSIKSTVETPADIEAKLQSKFESFDRHLANTGDGIPSPSNSAIANLDSQKRSRAQKNSEFFNPFQRRIRSFRCPRLDHLKSFYCPQLACIPYPKPRSRARVVCVRDDSITDKSSPSKHAPQSNQKEPSASKERPFQNKCGGQLEKEQQLQNTSPKQQNRVEVFQSKHCTQFDKEQSSDNQGYKRSNKGQQSSTKDPRRSGKYEKPSGSASMPCTSCFASPKPVSRFCKCEPEVVCGGPKLPCRSQSFHSTLLRSPSPLAVVLPQTSPCCRPCVVSTGRPRCRRFKCPTPTKCANKRSRSCSRSCPCGGKSPYCSSNPQCRARGQQQSPGICVPRKCVCDVCPYGTKPLSCLCPPCCMKPCCLPCPRKFTVFPYCQRVDATAKRYLSIPPCKMQSACPCPSGGPCNCPKPKKYPLPCCNFSPSPICKTACSTPTAISYIKSKQNDAACQRLLARYGFSPPMCSIGPASCYGGTSEGICPTSSCTRTYSCSGAGGCKSCHTSGSNQNRTPVCEAPVSTADSKNIVTPP